MNTRCANTEALDAHLKQVDREERRANAVSDYALELVCGELSICKFENFADALAEVIEDESALARIHCAITFGRSESAGIMLRQAIEKVLAERAEQMAISHVDSSCQKCEDAERRAKAVNDEALGLITGELSIYDEENFVSALSDLIERYDPALGTIHRALLAGHLNIAAQTLYQAVGKVLVARADAQAEAYVAKACQDCYGRGCRKCDPPEPDRYDD